MYWQLIASYPAVNVWIFLQCMYSVGMVQQSQRIAASTSLYRKFAMDFNLVTYRRETVASDLAAATELGTLGLMRTTKTDQFAHLSRALLKFY